MLALSLFAAFFVGTLMPIQAAVNARLGATLGKPLVASFLSFLCGTTILGLLALSQNAWAARWRDTLALPWWAWSGGALGACFVSAALLLVPKLGATLLVALFVSGQLFMSVLMDHHGWLGLQTRPLDPWRILGVILLILGVLAITRSSHAA